MPRTMVAEIRAVAALVKNVDRRFLLYNAADFLAGRLHILAMAGDQASLQEVVAAYTIAARIMREEGLEAA